MKTGFFLGFLACTAIAGCAATESGPDVSSSARNALTGEEKEASPPTAAPAEDDPAPDPGPAKETTNTADVAEQNACLSRLKASLFDANGDGNAMEELADGFAETLESTRTATP